MPDVRSTGIWEFRSLLATFSILLSATLWGLIWYPMRKLEQAGMTGLWLIAVMFAVMLVTVLVLRWSHYRFQRQDLPALLILGLAVGWCNVSFSLALIEGEVARVTLLFFLSPVWTVLLGRWILAERITRHSITGILLALLGAAIMLWHPEKGLPVPKEIADWLALSAGVTFAVANVVTRRLQLVTAATKVVATGAGTLFIAVFWLGLTGAAMPDTSPQIWFEAALLGLTFILVATFALQYGVTRLPVQYSSVILLFEIVVGATSAWLLANEVMTLVEIAGGLLLVFAGLYVGYSQLPLVSKGK